MIYEYRVYETAHRGQVPTLLALIEASMPAFERAGMRVVGCWTTADGIAESNSQVIYMLEFRDLAHLERCWRAFRSDPQMIEETGAVTGGGYSFLSRVSNTVMSPTNFSPPIKT